MKCVQKHTGWVGLLVSLALVGCGGTSPTDTAAKQDAAASDHDHKHADGSDHDHGAGEAGAHEHGPAPHGGTLVDWGGGKYHVEFTVDHPTQKAVVYLLGSDAATASPVNGKGMMLSLSDPVVQIELQPAPLEGEAADRCSRFEGQHEALGKVQEFSGTLSGEIDGTPYAADFAEEAHDH